MRHKLKEVISGENMSDKERVDTNDTYKPQYLYIEQYIDPNPPVKKSDEENDDDSRGVIIIDIF